MDAGPVDRTGGPSVALASLVGAVLAGVPIGLSMVFAGGGHGTVVPFHVFFGPVWLVWRLASPDDPPPHWAWVVFFSGMVLLYAGYAALLAVARRRRRRARVLVWRACLAIHYLSAICLEVYLSGGYGLRHFCSVAADLPVPWVIALTEYFLALHLLGAQYARSDRPYRPHLSWVVASVLLVGLLASLACATWGRAQRSRAAACEGARGAAEPAPAAIVSGCTAAAPAAGAPWLGRLLQSSSGRT